MLRLTAPRFFIRCLCLFLAGAGLSACAAVPGRTTTDDPWQGVNRSIYRFNEVFDRTALKPAAQTYRAFTPQWFRTGIRNFYKHLGTPVVMANELLQGKPQLVAQDTCRFVLNTLVGLGGFIDVAGKLQLYAHDEDFGQTLAVWGVPSGPYVMLPFLGPSTVRDGFGRVPDYLGRPQRYTDIPWEADAGLSVLEAVQLRASLLNVEESLNQAYDKYGVIRDAWLQRREFQIYDGNPPPEPALQDEPDMAPEDDTATDAPDSGGDAPVTP